MYLAPAEIKLFPPDHILPLYGVGLKGRSRPRPRQIIAYQFIFNACPYYEEKGHHCTIYDKRPEICRSFPLEALGYASRTCQFIAANIGDRETFEFDLDSIKEEMKANYQSHVYLGHFLADPNEILWVYPLNQKKWQIRRRGEGLP